MMSRVVMPFRIRFTTASPDARAKPSRRRSGAGGAAHLPGMVASLTALPVIGVPVPLANLEGMDSLLSIVQMPAGIPVATVGIGNAKNAGILAARILATSDNALLSKVESAMQKLNEEAKAKGAALKARRNQKTGF